MGRKTYESLPFKPLKNRINIVVTKQDIKLEGCIVVSNINDAISVSKKYNKEIFIIGGNQIYKNFIDIADRLYLTHIFHKFKNVDTYFPQIDYSKYKLEKIEYKDENIDHKYPHLFAVYTKRIQLL